MLCNASNVSTGGTGGRIARVFLGGEASDAELPMGVDMSATALEKFAGLYRDPVTGNPQELRFVEGELRDGNARLIPLSDREFAIGANGRRYVFDDAGRSSFRIEDWQYSDHRLDPVEPWEPKAAELEAFTGTYRSEDAETTYVVRAEAGELAIWQRPSQTSSMAPIYRDAFRMGGNIVRFRREGGGRVTMLSLSLGRVYDMRFDRIE
jgi:hypothetical protein